MYGDQSGEFVLKGLKVKNGHSFQSHSHITVYYLTHLFDF